MKVPVGLATMNSKELNVNVPLATGESDSEEFEVMIVTPFLREIFSIFFSMLNFNRELLLYHLDLQLVLCLLKVD